uniref:ARAD1D30074p n=1 Tax=Blastobotrys adeninivorans TaxID=409370 RepID=A0A060TGF7_BLAAD
MPGANNVPSFRRLSGKGHAERQSETQSVYERGFLQGRYSDVTVESFDKAYKLHRLQLSASPYFDKMFSSEWNEKEDEREEQGNRVYKLGLDDGLGITKEAFECVLARLYGYVDEKEDSNLCNLIATANYFGLDGMCWEGVTRIIDKSLTTDNVGEISNFFFNNDLGKFSNEVLTACKALLCDSLSTIPEALIAKVPGPVLAEVLSSDGLYVKDEEARFALVSRIYGSWRGPTASLEDIREVFNSGIHYCHFDSKSLLMGNAVRSALKLGLVSREVLKNAVWLRQQLQVRVLNGTSEMLGLISEEEEGKDDDEYTSGDDWFYPVPQEDGEEELKTFMPPLRFSVRLDVTTERSHSQTIWYGGSYWRVYCQKIDGSDQIGVYVHRAASRKGYGGVASETGSGAEQVTTKVKEYFDGRHASHYTGSFYSAWNSSDYEDKRKTASAYFEIYAYACEDSSLICLSSAPDTFDLGQSWGWKSSKLTKAVGNAAMDPIPQHATPMINLKH